MSRTLTIDTSMIRRLARALLWHRFRDPAFLGLVVLMMVGYAWWSASRGLSWSSVAAMTVGVGVLYLAVTYAALRRALRAQWTVGGHVCAGIDRDGRFTIQLPLAASTLAPAEIESVHTAGGCRIIKLRTRAVHIALPMELLDDADVELLQSGASRQGSVVPQQPPVAPVTVVPEAVVPQQVLPGDGVPEPART